MLLQDPKRWHIDTNNKQQQSGDLHISLFSALTKIKFLVCIGFWISHIERVIFRINKVRYRAVNIFSARCCSLTVSMSMGNRNRIAIDVQIQLITWRYLLFPEAELPI